MTRKRIDIWLFPENPSDKVVLRVVKALKKKRLFRQTVIDGIMILNQLYAGKTDLLFKKFPWIIDKVLATYAPKIETTTPPGPDDLERMIQGAVSSSVKEAMMNMPSLPATTPVAAPLKPALGGLTKMSLPLVDDDDEEEDTLVIVKKEIDIMANFFKSFGLVENHVSDGSKPSARTRDD